MSVLLEGHLAWAGTRVPETEMDADGPTFICQSTQVAAATVPLRWWDVRQYLEDCGSGNVRVVEMPGVFVPFVFELLVNAGLGLGAPLRFLYDLFQRLVGGTPYPWRPGAVEPGTKTPVAKLDLQPGEFVRIRKYQEILATLSAEGKNRGMGFDAEMVPFCGGTYRVLDRISRIINEKSGKMQHLQNECIILDGVTCQAYYARYRRFCPRGIYPYWREIWLERSLE
jgi:hypothetical protein